MSLSVKWHAQYRIVSRETKERTFHVKLQPCALRYPATPAGRFQHEVVEVAGRDAWDPGSLRE